MTDSSRKRAAALVRVSTDQQADSGGSISDQERRIAEWCERNGAELVRTYGTQDRSGGQLATSPDFVQMLADADSDEWDLVVVESVDRFRRNLVDALTARNRLRECGKALHILNFGNEDMTAETGAGYYLFTFGSLQAEAERRSFKERGAKAHRTKVARSQWNGGFQPTGYRSMRGGEGERSRTLELDPAYEDHIRFMWERLIEGWATHRIARALTERGCRPPKGGERFSQVSVSNMAHSAIYAGHLHAYDENGKRVPGELGGKGDWPAYVSPEDWQRVQELMAGRRNRNHSRMGRPSKHFLLAGGIGVCGKCGEALWVRKDAHSDYYYCSSRKSDSPCGAKPFPRELVDLDVREQVASGGHIANLTEAIESAYAMLDQERGHSQKQLRKLTDECTRLERDLETMATWELTEETTHLYTTKVRLLTAKQVEREEFAQRLDGIEAARPTSQQAEGLAEAFRREFARDTKLGLEDLQQRLRDITVGVKVWWNEDAPHQDLMRDLGAAPSDNDIEVLIGLRDQYVRDLVASIDPAWLSEIMTSGSGVQMASGRSHRRLAGSRARGRAPRCAP